MPACQKEAAGREHSIMKELYLLNVRDKDSCLPSKVKTFKSKKSTEDYYNK